MRARALSLVLYLVLSLVLATCTLLGAAARCCWLDLAIVGARGTCRSTILVLCRVILRWLV